MAHKIIKLIIASLFIYFVYFQPAESQEGIEVAYNNNYIKNICQLFSKSQVFLVWKMIEILKNNICNSLIFLYD